MILALAIAAVAPPSPCNGAMGEVVPSEIVARGIAEAVIASRQPADLSAKFVLRLLEGRRREWLAYQVPIEGSPGRGGGGLEMKIAKCDGKITDLHFAR